MHTLQPPARCLLCNGQASLVFQSIKTPSVRKPSVTYSSLHSLNRQVPDLLKFTDQLQVSCTPQTFCAWPLGAKTYFLSAPFVFSDKHCGATMITPTSMSGSSWVHTDNGIFSLCWQPQKNESFLLSACSSRAWWCHQYQSLPVQQYQRHIPTNITNIHKTGINNKAMNWFLISLSVSQAAN